MILKLQNLEKLINSELSIKVLNSGILNEELLIEIKDNDIVDAFIFLLLFKSILSWLSSKFLGYNFNPELTIFFDSLLFSDEAEYNAWK